MLDLTGLSMLGNRDHVVEREGKDVVSRAARKLDCLPASLDASEYLVQLWV